MKFGWSIGIALLLAVSVRAGQAAEYDDGYYGLGFDHSRVAVTAGIGLHYADTPPSDFIWVEYSNDLKEPETPLAPSGSLGYLATYLDRPGSSLAAATVHPTFMSLVATYIVDPYRDPQASVYDAFTYAYSAVEFTVNGTHDYTGSIESNHQVGESLGWIQWELRQMDPSYKRLFGTGFGPLDGIRSIYGPSFVQQSATGKLIEGVKYKLILKVRRVQPPSQYGDTYGLWTSGSASLTLQLTPATELLIDNLADDVLTTGLSPGIANALVAKLEAARKRVADGDGPIGCICEEPTKSAMNQMNAFVNQVEAKRGKVLTDELADALITAAQAIIDKLNS